MEELFTPNETIEHFIERRAIKRSEIGVTPHVIISWGHRVIMQLAEMINARRSDHWL